MTGESANTEQVEAGRAWLARLLSSAVKLGTYDLLSKQTGADRCALHRLAHPPVSSAKTHSQTIYAVLGTLEGGAAWDLAEMERALRRHCPAHADVLMAAVRAAMGDGGE